MTRKILLPVCLLGLGLLLTTLSLSAAKSSPLYRYLTKSGFESYRLKKLPVGNLSGDSNTGDLDLTFFGRVGYVYQEKAPGTVPLYSLTRASDLGLRHFYTTDFNEALDLQDKQGWNLEFYNKGIACYVSPQAIPGKTIAVYRFRQTNAASDARLRFGSQEYQKWKALPGVKFDPKPMFYIWQNPPPSGGNDTGGAMPDLSIEKVTVVKAASVTFIARSLGYKVPKETIRVKITAYRPDGTVAWSQEPFILQTMPSGARVRITVQVAGDNSLSGLKFKLNLDPANIIDDSDRGNNETGLLAGPL